MMSTIIISQHKTLYIYIFCLFQYCPQSPTVHRMFNIRDLDMLFSDAYEVPCVNGLVPSLTRLPHLSAQSGIPHDAGPSCTTPRMHALIIDSAYSNNAPIFDRMGREDIRICGVGFADLSSPFLSV